MVAPPNGGVCQHDHGVVGNAQWLRILQHLARAGGIRFQGPHMLLAGRSAAVVHSEDPIDKWSLLLHTGSALLRHSPPEIHLWQRVACQRFACDYLPYLILDAANGIMSRKKNHRRKAIAIVQLRGLVQHVLCVVQSPVRPGKRCCRAGSERGSARRIKRYGFGGSACTQLLPDFHEDTAKRILAAPVSTVTPVVVVFDVLYDFGFTS